ncbi:prepilin peptidase [Streptococcus ferus]|uniref:prepilin peptidase n=2 Tax=Streptococcus ferus TaxID=1345 RepID=UPI0035A1258A
MKEILYFMLFSSFGSFMGVVVNRFPDQSLLSPGSHCDSCGTRLAPRDLIPVFSQLINRSHCRFCGCQISYAYLILESLCGLIGLAFCFQLLRFSQVFLLLFGILLSLYDLREQSYPFVIWVIFTLLLMVVFPLNLLSILLFLFGIFAALKDIKIGSGDFLYLATLALALDFQSILWIVQIASLLGILAFLLGVQKEKRLPFVPFLFIAYSCLLLVM